MKSKISAPALFMYSVIIITIIVCAISFALYYGDIYRSEVLLWVGIVAFMIVYHFWLRIIMGNVSKLFRINQNSRWFKEKPFEKRLYKLLRVRKWKDKALTYNPEAFSFEHHTLEEIASVMTKSEVDHWINEIISLVSILFSLIWGEFWIFAITALLAMLFDAQFIVIQRYNRPMILRVINRHNSARKRIQESKSALVKS